MAFLEKYGKIAFMYLTLSQIDTRNVTLVQEKAIQKIIGFLNEKKHFYNENNRKRIETIILSLRNLKSLSADDLKAMISILKSLLSKK